MIIRIISIGNKLNLSESKNIEYFIKQLPKNLQIEFINLKSQQNPKYSQQEVIKKESKLILSRIMKKDFVIACDSNGDQINSSQFSKLILRCQKKYKTICFIIGGSFGLSQEIKDNSNMVLSANEEIFLTSKVSKFSALLPTRLSLQIFERLFFDKIKLIY